jgi:hypothetical protein
VKDVAQQELYASALKVWEKDQAGQGSVSGMENAVLEDVDVDSLGQLVFVKERQSAKKDASVQWECCPLELV